MSFLEIHSVTSVANSDLIQEVPQFVSGNVAYGAVTESGVIIKVEKDPDDADFSGAALNFCVQPNWNETGISSWNHHSIIGSESSPWNVELSRNVNPYEDHSYSKISNGFIQDQMNLAEMGSSSNQNHIFENERIQLRPIKEESPDDQPEVEMFLSRFLDETDFDFTMETGIIIKKEADTVEEKNGDQMSFSYEFDQMDVQNCNDSIFKSAKIKKEEDLEGVEENGDQISFSDEFDQMNVQSCNDSIFKSVKIKKEKDLEGVDENGDQISFSDEFDQMNVQSCNDSIFKSVKIKKEEDLEDVEENGDKMSFSYEFDQMDDQNYNDAKIEETGQIDTVNELRSKDDHLSLSEHAKLTNDEASTKQNSFDGFRQPKVYYDHDHIHLKAVSVVLKDLFPKRHTKNLNSSAKFHLRSYNIANPKSPEEIRICAAMKNREELCKARRNSRDQLTQATMKEWYSCSICPARYKFVSSLAIHSTWFHCLFLCVECETLFISQSYLQAHLNTHTVRKLHLCPYCNFKCDKAHNLRRHASRHLNKKLCSCGECSAEFDRSIRLTAHLERVHRIKLSHRTRQQLNQAVAKEWFLCTICLARFKFVSSLAKHLAKIHFFYLCIDCESVFMSQLDLCAHLKTHRMRKLHLCPYCCFRCKGASRLKIHANIIHPNELLFSCGECFTEFDGSPRLLAHLADKHRKVFTCALCPSRFRTEASLKNHTNKHMKNTLFVCYFCPAEFTLRDAVIQHQKSHAAVRRSSFPCIECSARFNSYLDLNSHMLIHPKNEKSLVCADNTAMYKTKTASEGYVPKLQQDHTNEKSFSHSDCDGSLKFKNSVEHQIIQTDDKSFPSANWDTNFKSDLITLKSLQHQVINNDETSLCEVCGASFRKAKDLTKHQVIHFPGEKPVLIPGKLETT